MEDFQYRPILQGDKHLCQIRDFQVYFHRQPNQILLPVMINKLITLPFEIYEVEGI